MRNTSRTIHYEPKRVALPRPLGAQKVLPVMGKTQGRRSAKGAAKMGKLAGSIPATHIKTTTFTGITPDTKRLKKMPPAPPRPPVSSERHGRTGKQFPVYAGQTNLGMGKVIRAKAWGGRTRSRCLVEVDGREIGWATFTGDRFIVTDRRH